MATFGRLNRNELPMVFGVRGVLLGRRCEPTWYRVQLPIRPNGSIGWVRASTVSIAPIHTRIVADVSGCVRLPNPVVRRLFKQVFAGTPVIIHP
jgi:hypothetical protein